MKADGGINSFILDERLKNSQDLLTKLLDGVGTVVGNHPIEPEVVCNGEQIDILQRKNTFFTGVSFGVSQSHLHFLLRLLI